MVVQAIPWTCGSTTFIHEGTSFMISRNVWLQFVIELKVFLMMFEIFVIKYTC